MFAGAEGYWPESVNQARCRHASGLVSRNSARSVVVSSSWQSRHVTPGVSEGHSADGRGRRTATTSSPSAVRRSMT